MRRRTIVASVLVLAAAAVPAARAGAGPTLTLHPSTVSPGGRVTAAGAGFPRHQIGVLSVGRTPSSLFLSGSRGTFRRTFSVPAGAQRSLTVSATAGRARASASLTIAKPSTGRWRPAQGTSWQIQLTGAVDTSVAADVFDVDGLDAGAPSAVSALRARGVRLICYLDAGTWEPWRPDAASFPESLRGGAVEGFEDERWLDIRRLDVLLPLMRARADTCDARGFDAIDWDNVDGYANDTGFPLSASDQLAFNRALAAIAHQRGLAVGLKNDVDQAAALQADFDFAVNEECFDYDECASYRPFVDAGKAVLQIEYELPTSAFCASARAMRFSSLRKRVDLDAYREAC